MEHYKFAKLSSIAVAVLLFLSGLTSAFGLTIPSLIFGFLLIPTFIIFACYIHYFASEKNKIYGLIGIIFSSMYGVLIAFNYFYQLVDRARNISMAEAFDITDPNSTFLTIELLGYFFMGLATLFLIPIFSNSKLDKSIKLLFLLNAILGVGGIVGYLLEWDMRILIVGLVGWNLIMPIAAILMFYHFKQLEKSFRKKSHQLKRVK